MPFKFFSRNKPPKGKLQRREEGAKKEEATSAANSKEEKVEQPTTGDSPDSRSSRITITTPASHRSVEKVKKTYPRSPSPMRNGARIREPEVPPRRSSLPNGTHPSTPTTPSASDVPSSFTITLLIGHQDPNSAYLIPREFHLPSTLLKKCGSSLLRNEPYEPHGPAHHLPHLDPTAFATYIDYLCTAHIAPPNVSDDTEAPRHWTPNAGTKLGYRACWPLINAHILGTQIRDPEFADYAMDILEDKVDATCALDLVTARHVFGAQAGAPALKKLLLDRFVVHQIRTIELDQLVQFPGELLGMLVLRLRAERGVGEVVKSGCAYHVHGSERACYMAQRQKVLAKREGEDLQRRALTEESRREREVAASHGVLAMDWQERNGGATRLEIGDEGIVEVEGAGNGIGDGDLDGETNGIPRSIEVLIPGAVGEKSVVRETSDGGAGLEGEGLKVKILHSEIEHHPFLTVKEQETGAQSMFYDIDSSEHDSVADEELADLVRNWRRFECPGAYPQTPVDG
ncbi:hypothetical protein EJ04DRAFT_583613 [Polyplosphaeria fusca]|uniref:BTB domain-containing protein n=1 Tax=Polyplosphaeria fusca TaxID=682080 RepID=A0A9P4UZS6_9PLEO|nr:hypothetical protein EJ04DRAFT_583613 [Polyplosphaeria fusca]